MYLECLTQGRTDHFGNIFPPVTIDEELWPMISTLEVDLYSIQLNQFAKYLALLM